MILYGNHESGHSFKVRLFLQLTDTPHEYHWIDLTQPRSQRHPSFVANSLFGEVPVLIDNEKSLCQSNSILMYLAQKNQQLCGTPTEWAHIVEWLYWESNRIGFSLPNLRFALRWSPQPQDVLDYLRNRVLSDLKTLNRFLSQSQFLVPSGLTIADISCSAYLFWLSQTGISIEDYPSIQRWLIDISQQPSWQHPDVALKAT